MITHANYDAAMPQPHPVALATLLNPPPIQPPARGTAQKRGTCGISNEVRPYNSGARGVAAWESKAHDRRIATYRPALHGKGWRDANWISEKTGVMVDSVRQRMLKLEESGDVDIRKMVDRTVQYKWVGK